MDNYELQGQEEFYDSLNESEKKESDELKSKVFIYLNELRESGRTNMFGARPYIVQEFGIDKSLAGRLLQEWMNNF